MDQHALPRQITTFEFKLIGFFTLKQFGYLAFFSILSFIFFNIIPIPILNIVIATLCALLGVALVFLPINERPLDIWIKNFIRKLYSPSQYYYHKKNPPPNFLKDITLFYTPHMLQTHIDARQKLSSYLKKNLPPVAQQPRQTVHQLIYAGAFGNDSIIPPEELIATGSATKNKKFAPQKQPTPLMPFLEGTVKNYKNIPLPNMLVYIKDSTGKTRRILKTNHMGMFATFHPLSAGNYIFEINDPDEKYRFDKIESVITNNNNELNFYSKELI